MMGKPLPPLGDKAYRPLKADVFGDLGKLAEEPPLPKIRPGSVSNAPAVPLKEQAINDSGEGEPRDSDRQAGEGVQTMKVSLYLQKPLVRQLKLRAADMGTTLKALVNEALEDYFRKNGFIEVEERKF